MPVRRRSPAGPASGTRIVRSDAFCPRTDQERLLAEITGARLMVYERAGHALHWEEPERFAADLVAFAENLDASSTQHAVSTPGRTNQARGDYSLRR